MEKRYRVTLTVSERDDLRKLVSVGKAAAQKLVRARILLLADQAEGGSSKSDPEIVESLGCGRASVSAHHNHSRHGRYPGGEFDSNIVFLQEYDHGTWWTVAERS